MLRWLTENLPTILISLVLLAVVAAILRSLVKNKKNGRSSCGCGCSSCSVNENCRKT